MKVCITSNTSWSIFNFRKNLIKAIVADGHEVFVLAPDESYYKNVITSWGCSFITLKSVSSKSMNPFANIKFCMELRKIFRENQFDVVLSYTPKPNIWGAIASKKTNTRFIPTVNGLGYAFINQNWLSFIVARLYRYAFKELENVVFQNPDDVDFFKLKKIVTQQQAVRVPGSGVDLDHFYPSQNINHNSNTLRFLYAGRLIKAKGVVEYVEASALLKKKYPEVSFYMVGAVSENPSSVSMKQVEKWINSGVIKYYALTDDMSGFLDDMDILVFPSYYMEGIPKILLEACAKEIPVITTDNVGCNQVVVNDFNGLVVTKKNIESLVTAMESMILMGPMKRKAMGRNGRKLVEESFDEKTVIATYLKLLSQTSTIKLQHKKQMQLH